MRLLYHIANESQYTDMQIIFSNIQYEVGIVCIEEKKNANYGIFPMSMIWGNFKKKKKQLETQLTIGGMKEDRPFVQGKPEQVTLTYVSSNTASTKNLWIYISLDCTFSLP